MKISELILKLEDIKSTEGDLPISLLGEEEEWYEGRVYTHLNDVKVNFILLKNTRYASEVVKAVCLT